MSKLLEMHSRAEVAGEVKAIALKGDMPTQVAAPQSRADLKALRAAGTEIWLDTGDRNAAGKLWTVEMSGLTTNNTLANQVVQTGIMDSVIKEASTKIKKAIPGITEEELVIEVGFVVNARIARSLVSKFNAMVSVELHPLLAYDTEATVLFGRRYFELNPDNFFVKVPMTPEGLLAVRRLELENIPVNLTLGFSARQNHLAARLANPSFVNIFLGRLNQVVKENGIGDGNFIGEKVTLASQSDIKEARESVGAKTRQIAASLRAGHQVATLAGVDVHTIPPKAMEEFFNMNMAPEDIRPNLDSIFEINVASGETPESTGIDVLWDVDDVFQDATDLLLKEDLDKFTGGDLVAFLQDNGVDNLFADYSPDDRAGIRKTGKIPHLKDWSDRNVAIDDLMTISALESFSKDQGELDERIKSML